MIIFINGSINSGKSTIAKILENKLQGTALLEIDFLRDMIGWMPITEAVPISLENTVSLIKNFSNRNLNVIVPYPLSQKNYDYIKERLKDLNIQTYFFTLSPSLDKVLTNRGSRELDDWERERIKYHYEIGIQKPSFGEIIDNTDQSPEETAGIILSKIQG